jgi:hypothetical protein
MINIVFSKMEAYSGNFGISLSKLQARNSFVKVHKGTGSIEDGDISMKNPSSTSGDRSL